MMHKNFIFLHVFVRGYGIDWANLRFKVELTALCVKKSGFRQLYNGQKVRGRDREIC